MAVVLSLCSNGCEKEKQINLDVDNYIDLLKSGKYDSLRLPAFTPADIPALLMYRNEGQIITDFPHNPISSFWNPECRLGVYVLWTIESIRATSINSKYVVMGFPSLNPMLALKNTEDLDLVEDVESHEKAAKAYYDWWYSDSSYDIIKSIDPLINTEYKWH